MRGGGGWAINIQFEVGVGGSVAVSIGDWDFFISCLGYEAHIATDKESRGDNYSSAIFQKVRAEHVTPGPKGNVMNGTSSSEASTHSQPQKKISFP